MTKIILEGTVKCDKEDGGQALISSIEGQDDFFFVRLQSWDENCEHSTMKSLEGKKVRVTVEVID